MLSKNLKRLRMLRRLSQVELSRISGVSQPTISELELGRKHPSLGTASRLAKALKVPITKLI